MAKKKEKPAKKQQPANPTPRQKTLPGMQDRRVAVLEKAALEYADIRDERMQWTKKEVETKKRVKDLMHEQQRTHYAHGNIEIDLVPEDEHVRVRIHDREREQEPDDETPVKEPDDDIPKAENPDDYDSSHGPDEF